MIISYPTGSYNMVLPKDVSDTTSVVYTISNTTPPRSNLSFLQIPTGVEYKKRSSREIPDNIRRSAVGPLVSTQKRNKANTTESGNQLFYPEQVFEFAASTQFDAIDDVNSDIDVDYNQHYTDYSSIGLTSSDKDTVLSTANKTQDSILSELEDLQKSKSDLQIQIVNQQRIINECNRIIDGLNTILGTTSNDEVSRIKRQTEETKQSASKSLEKYTSQLNALPSKIRTKHDELRALSSLLE